MYHTKLEIVDDGDEKDILVYDILNVKLNDLQISPYLIINLVHMQNIVLSFPIKKKLQQHISHSAPKNSSTRMVPMMHGIGFSFICINLRS